MFKANMSLYLTSGEDILQKRDGDPINKVIIMEKFPSEVTDGYPVMFCSQITTDNKQCPDVRVIFLSLPVTWSPELWFPVRQPESEVEG